MRPNVSRIGFRNQRLSEQLGCTASPVELFMISMRHPKTSRDNIYLDSTHQASQVPSKTCASENTHTRAPRTHHRKSAREANNWHPDTVALFQVLALILTSWCVIGIGVYFLSVSSGFDSQMMSKPRIYCGYHPDDVPYLVQNVTQNQTRFCRKYLLRYLFSSTDRCTIKGRDRT